MLIIIVFSIKRRRTSKGKTYGSPR